VANAAGAQGRDDVVRLHVLVGEFGRRLVLDGVDHGDQVVDGVGVDGEAEP
jgi:hypothetical protein